MMNHDDDDAGGGDAVCKIILCMSMSRLTQRAMSPSECLRLGLRLLQESSSSSSRILRVLNTFLLHNDRERGGNNITRTQGRGEATHPRKKGGGGYSLNEERKKKHHHHHHHHHNLLLVCCESSLGERVRAAVQI